MKLYSSRLVGRRLLKSLPLCIGLVSCPFWARGTDSIASFTGTYIYLGAGYPYNNIPAPPQVDATNFYNSGTWNISTAPYPYFTANTLNFTNTGSMTGSVGWEFDYGPSDSGSPSGRGMAASFFNDTYGVIRANDGYILNPPNAQYSTPVSYLLVSATNIVNKGMLMAGPNGQIILNGTNVVLSRSILQIGAIAAVGSADFSTNFFPDTAIYDEYWGQGSTNVVTPFVWQSPTVTSAASPNLAVGDPCAGTNSAPVLSFTPSFDAWREVADPNSITNLSTNGSPVYATNRYFRQAVFVVVNSGDFATNNPATNSLIRFLPSGNPSNLFETVTVWLHSPNAGDLYIVDTLGSLTNRGLYKNSSPPPPGGNPLTSCSAAPFRPANYTVERLDNSFASGTSGNVSAPPGNFLYDLTFSNATVTADVSAYQAYVDDLASDPYGTPLSDLPGRVVINANNLDLDRTTITNPGPEIVINANNLTGTARAISCQNFSYNLGSSNGTVNVQNLTTNGTFPGLKGTVSLWSALWTNSMPESHTIMTTNGPVTTNTISELDFHVLLVDASGLSSTVPIRVQDLNLQTNAVLNDSMNVVNSFLFSGQSLTLNGAFSLSGNLQNWNGGLAPSLLYFTNNGSLSIPNEAHFGDDTAVPYAEFVNNGQIAANGVTVHSLDFQVNGGPSFSYIGAFSGNFSAMAQSAELMGGASGAGIFSGGNIQLIADSLLMDNFSLYTFDGTINLTVSNSLSDDGAPSSFYCNNGFNLWVAPQMGDLSDSTISDYAPSNSFGTGPEIDHAWAGVDYGPSGWSSATTNNAPIGDLILIAQAPSQLPTFRFYGTGGAPSNALYVTTLDLSQLTDIPGNLASMIQIDPGMKIYFLNVKVSPTFSAALGGQTPMNYLESQFPGQIIGPPHVVVAQSGSVDWNTVYQRIDGFGASCAFSGRTWSTNTANIFFSTNNVGTNICIGLSLLRNEVQPGGYATASEIGLMQLAQARGARIWSTPWSPQASFKDNDSIVGGNFLSAYYQAYADQLAGYVANLKVQYGIDLYALSIQNEPDANVNYVSCHWTPQQFHDFVPYLHSALVASNVAFTKIMLPEDEFWTTNYYALAMSDPAVATNVDIIGDHNYYNSGYPAAPLPLYSNTNAAVWETEVMTSDAPDGSIANGMMWAARIYDFLTVAQANAWHYWWLISGNNDNEGLELTGDIPTKRMYVVGQFSRFVRPGYVRIGADAGGGNLLVTAFKDPNSQNFAIVAINTNVNTDVTQSFSLSNFAASSVTPWITSFNYSLAQMPAVTATNSSFAYTVPAQSVVTFVGHNDNAPPSNIRISSTAYQSTGPAFVLTWNSTAGKTYTVFKSGSLATPVAGWSPIVTGYPAGGAPGGPLSYTDTTATLNPAFYRVMAEQQATNQ